MCCTSTPSPAARDSRPSAVSNGRPWGAGNGNVEGVIRTDVLMVLPGQSSQALVRNTLDRPGHQTIERHECSCLCKTPVQHRTTQHRQHLGVHQFGRDQQGVINEGRQPPVPAVSSGATRLRLRRQQRTPSPDLHVPGRTFFPEQRGRRYAEVCLGTLGQTRAPFPPRQFTLYRSEHCRTHGATALAGMTAQALVQGLRYVLYLQRTHTTTITRPRRAGKSLHTPAGICRLSPRERAGVSEATVPLQSGGTIGGRTLDRQRLRPLSTWWRGGRGVRPASLWPSNQPALPPHARRNSPAVGKLVPAM